MKSIISELNTFNFAYFNISYLASLECFLYLYPRLYPDQCHETRVDGTPFKMAFSAHDIITANANANLPDDLSLSLYANS